MKNIIIKSVKFAGSCVNLQECPKPVFPEYAFVGRSNVGKSSLINMITNRKKIARISNSPGKTRCINHYLINEQWYMVDLPGYGFAKVSMKERESWRKIINQYIRGRKNLLCTFLLIDSRHTLQKSDDDFIKWLGTEQIPFILLFTKADKIKYKHLQKNIDTYKSALSESWDELPEYILTSAVTKLGRKEILEFIEKTNRIFNKK